MTLSSPLRVLLALLLLVGASAWAPLSSPRLGKGRGVRSAPLAERLQQQGLVKAAQVASGLALTTPLAAHAEVSSSALGAVSIPLLISILVMGPFLYYSNQLKPKERTVRQIELDENLKATGKDKSSGSVGQAKATKKR